MNVGTKLKGNPSNSYQACGQKSKKVKLLVMLVGSQGITRGSRIHSLASMTVCTRIHGSPSNTWEISLWTKVVTWDCTPSIVKKKQAALLCLEWRMWTIFKRSTLFCHFLLSWSWNSGWIFVLFLFYCIEQNEPWKQKGGLHFGKGCWLRTSEFHLLMFKLRCLVFPFHWLKGLAGLCLAPSRLLSPFPVKGGVVPCAAYLRRYSGISCPFYFDHAGGGDEWAVTAHWQLTLRHPSSCLMFIHEARWKI